MAADQTIKVTDQSTGKNVDVSEITQSDGSTIAERQRINISDPENPDAHAQVEDGKLLTADAAILAELKALRATVEDFTTRLSIALKL
jgi:hypothetical protein